MPPSTRRSVLGTAAGAVATGVLGATTATAAPELDDEVALEISTLGQVTLFRDPNVTSSSLRPRLTAADGLAGDRTVPFGGDADYRFRITRAGSDDELRFVPDDDSATHEISSISFETGYDPTESMDESVSVSVTAEGTGGLSYVDGRFVGDLDIFDREPFADYRVALLDGNGSALIESPPTRVATRYEWDLEQSDETLRIARDPGTPDDLSVEWSIYERGDRPSDELAETAVENAGDEFVIDLSQFDLDLENGRYDWDLEFYEADDDGSYLLSLHSDDGTLALPYGGDSAEEMPGPGFAGGVGAVGLTVGGLYAFRRRVSQ
ncbi:hypothetical protein [Natronolimnohabitans innermongolicus]|uniref:Uncharacterized protein n=1 Tax=Natronolimnohabitans innermongolicus JCM 12255 TaxID=1227499 RepID=L9X612_9EURY|nr:hypothetical protein [Natronolimnohabitans innermongolicus]ELY57032.1 hypothetical protein C493_09398 [Natronolimnohabitans innermongolicus JCM 12255]